MSSTRSVPDPSTRSGDPFVAAGAREYKRLAERLRRLEERLAHELLPDEERQELRDRILRLRRRLEGEGD